MSAFVSHRLLALVLGATATLVASQAQAGDYPEPTLSALLHRDTDGFCVKPAEGDSLMAAFRVGDKELSLQIHDAFVPAAGSMPGANGIAPASLGGCVVDEAGLLVAGWGIDAAGEAYGQLPQILGGASATDDEGKLNALSGWCDSHAQLWQQFTAVARELEIESAIDQEAVLGPRTAAWRLMLSHARNIEALCLFAKHQSRQAISVRDYFTR